MSYSNTNTVLLGLVVEKLTGPADRRLHRRPHHGAARDDADELPARLLAADPHADGYSRDTADGSIADATGWNPTWTWAAGQMVSTLRDLRVWARSLATGDGLLAPATQAERAASVTGRVARSPTGSACSTSEAGSATTARCPATRRSRCTAPDADDDRGVHQLQRRAQGQRAQHPRGRGDHEGRQPAARLHIARRSRRTTANDPRDESCVARSRSPPPPWRARRPSPPAPARSASS